MFKPHNQFGGWLIFFQLLAWFDVGYTGILLMRFLWLIFSNHQRILPFQTALIVLQSMLGIIIFYTIAIILPRQSVTIPQRIEQLLIGFIGIQVIFTFGNVACNFWYPYYFSAGWLRQGLLLLVNGVLGPIFWIGCFRVSKRVKSYYLGKDMGSQKE